MTDLTLKKRNSRNYQVTITEADLVTPIDITNGILRFAVKRGDEDNDDAVIFKTSYDPAEIEITDGPNGVCLVKVFAGDTYNDPLGEYVWDMDLHRRLALLTSAGTIAVTNGIAVVTGTGLDLSDVLPGDVLVPAGAGAPNQKDLVIISVGGDGSDLDPGAGNLLTDYTEWTTEGGVTVDIYRGDAKTPVSGCFTLTRNTTT